MFIPWLFVNRCKQYVKKHVKQVCVAEGQVLYVAHSIYICCCSRRWDLTSGLFITVVLRVSALDSLYSKHENRP